MIARLSEDSRDSFFARSLTFLQENVRQAGPAASAGYTLIGSIILLGGVGYALDAWRGSTPGVRLGGLPAGMLAVVQVRPVRFVASFTSYFIALHLTEALMMRRLFA